MVLRTGYYLRINEFNREVIIYIYRYRYVCNAIYTISMQCSFTKYINKVLSFSFEPFSEENTCTGGVFMAAVPVNVRNKCRKRCSMMCRRIRI